MITELYSTSHYSESHTSCVSRGSNGSILITGLRVKLVTSHKARRSLVPQLYSTLSNINERCAQTSVRSYLQFRGKNYFLSGIVRLHIMNLKELGGRLFQLDFGFSVSYVHLELALGCSIDSVRLRFYAWCGNSQSLKKKDLDLSLQVTLVCLGIVKKSYAFNL